MENRLRFDKITDSLKVGNVLRHSVGGGAIFLFSTQMCLNDNGKVTC